MRVLVHTPLGDFHGNAASNATEKDKEALVGLIEMAARSDLSFLTLNLTGGGRAYFPEEILKNSVLVIED